MFSWSGDSHEKVTSWRQKRENKRESGHRGSNMYLWGSARSPASCPPAVWRCRRSWWSAPRGICHHLPESSPLWWRCQLCQYWRQLRSSPVPTIKRHKRQVTTNRKAFSLSSWSETNNESVGTPERAVSLKLIMVSYISPWAFILNIKAKGTKPPKLLSEAALHRLHHLIALNRYQSWNHRTTEQVRKDTARFWGMN